MHRSVFDPSNDIIVITLDKNACHFDISPVSSSLIKNVSTTQRAASKHLTEYIVVDMMCLSYKLLVALSLNRIKNVVLYRASPTNKFQLSFFRLRSRITCILLPHFSDSPAAVSLSFLLPCLSEELFLFFRGLSGFYPGILG